MASSPAIKGLWRHIAQNEFILGHCVPLPCLLAEALNESVLWKITHLHSRQDSKEEDVGC